MKIRQGADAPCGAFGRGKRKGESLFTFLGSKGHFLVKILEKEAFDKAGLIYGMGHAVYSISDPRAKVFKKYKAVQKALEPIYNGDYV